MANNTEVKDLLEAGVHFGHLTRKWNPNMAPYIYMERNGIHIINLYKTAAKIEEANEALKKIAASGRKILFVATKKQAKDIVAEKAKNANMPYITERWPGGMLTNFVTIRKAVKKMASIDRMKADGTFLTLSKKERLQVDRLRAKLEKNLGSISDMSRLPAALFIVDTTREHIAVAEAQKLNIPIFAMVDTNSDPRVIDYVIPSNDDASKSIDKVMTAVSNAIIEGLSERKSGKDNEEETNEVKETKAPKKEKVAKKVAAEVPSTDADDKKEMQEAKQPVKLESKSETIEKADLTKEEE
jgi:small subunit ribosomal protein S2